MSSPKLWVTVTALPYVQVGDVDGHVDSFVLLAVIKVFHALKGGCLTINYHPVFFSLCLMKD